MGYCSKVGLGLVGQKGGGGLGVGVCAGGEVLGEWAGWGWCGGQGKVM